MKYIFTQTKTIVTDVKARNKYEAKAKGQKMLDELLSDEDGIEELERRFDSEKKAIYKLEHYIIT